MEGLDYLDDETLNHLLAAGLDLDARDSLPAQLRRARAAGLLAHDHGWAGGAGSAHGWPQRAAGVGRRPGAPMTSEERLRIIATSDVADRFLDNREQGADNGNNAGGNGECIICMESGMPMLQLPCGCWYCAPCLRQCLRTGLTNEGSWPPRCHQPLTEDAVRWAVGNSHSHARLFDVWRESGLEWGVLPRHRTYCHSRDCGSFIPPNTQDPERCLVCGRRTCRQCKRQSHPGTACVEEHGENEQVMDMMDDNGFAGCDQCGRVVELADGCNHMTYVSPLFPSLSLLAVSIFRGISR